MSESNCNNNPCNCHQSRERCDLRILRGPQGRSGRRGRTGPRGRSGERGCRGHTGAPGQPAQQINSIIPYASGQSFIEVSVQSSSMPTQDFVAFGWHVKDSTTNTENANSMAYGVSTPTILVSANFTVYTDMPIPSASPNPYTVTITCLKAAANSSTFTAFAGAPVLVYAFPNSLQTTMSLSLPFSPATVLNPLERLLVTSFATSANNAFANNIVRYRITGGITQQVT
jgi:hypothetical protein